MQKNNKKNSVTIKSKYLYDSLMHKARFPTNPKQMQVARKNKIKDNA